MYRVFVAVLIGFGLIRTPAAAAGPSSQADSNQSPSLLLDGFDEYVKRVMQKWHIPGLAIGVIHDGKVVHTKAFGVRHAKKPSPVTIETLFPIGSITKSFTATGIGLLVDDGKLHWDVPIREYLPEFRLRDDVATLHATPRDLLTHRTGVPEHLVTYLATREWLDTHLSRRNVMHALGDMQPSAGFREKYQYNNEMYITAGLLFEAVDGRTWETFTQERILSPLGMLSTYLNPDDVPADANIAAGHVDTTGNGDFDPIGFVYRGRALGPAGTMVSNVPDMLRWLLLHIHHGQHNGHQLLNTESAVELTRPLIQLPDVDPADHVGGFYGMGFMVFADSARKKWVHHAGHGSDCTSLLGFMPAEQAGIVILTNWSPRGGSYTPLMAIAANFKRRVIRQPPRDEIARYYKVDASEWERRKQEEQQIESERHPGTEPSHEWEDYAGVYRHPAFGTFDVFLEEDRLQYRFHGVTRDLTHYHYDLFRLDLFGARFATFRYDRSGTINRVLIDFVPAVDDIEFVREEHAP